MRISPSAAGYVLQGHALGWRLARRGDALRPSSEATIAPLTAGMQMVSIADSTLRPPPAGSRPENPAGKPPPRRIPAPGLAIPARPPPPGASAAPGVPANP